LAFAMSVIFKNLYEKQISSRDSFLKDFETCCAAANDFIRMAERFDVTVFEVKKECNFSPDASLSLDEQSAALIETYSKDAVFAAKKAHTYIFEPIEEAIANDLFGTKWLDELTQNELAFTLVRTLDDFVQDLEKYMDEIMVPKAVEALITASVLFYVNLLLGKSRNHKGKLVGPYFSNIEKALVRMTGDITVLREYFEDLSAKMPVLTSVMDREFEFLYSIHEMMAIAAGTSNSEAQDFVLVMQKQIQNIHLTKFIVGDLWNLTNPHGERYIYGIVDSIQQEMSAVAVPTTAVEDRSSVPGLELVPMIAKHLNEDKRKRPLKPLKIRKKGTVANNN